MDEMRLHGEVLATSNHETKIASTLMNMQSTKKLWEEIEERYGQTNAPQLFQLKKEIWELEQNNLGVSEYYCKLKELWDQIGELEDVPECVCGAMIKCACSIAKKMLEMQHNDRLMKFLMGLNCGYD